MKRRRTLARRIAARRRLLEMAHDLAPFFARASLEAVVRGRAPELVRTLDEREVRAVLERAVLELAARPLHG